MEIRHADLQIEVEDAEDGGVLLTIIDSARLSLSLPRKTAEDLLSAIDACMKTGERQTTDSVDVWRTADDLPLFGMHVGIDGASWTCGAVRSWDVWRSGQRRKGPSGLALGRAGCRLAAVSHRPDGQGREDDVRGDGMHRRCETDGDDRHQQIKIERGELAAERARAELDAYKAAHDGLTPFEVVRRSHDSQAMPDDRMEPGIEPTLF